MKKIISVIGILLILFTISCKKEEVNVGFIHKFTIVNEGTSTQSSFPAKQFTYMTIEPSTFSYGGPLERFFVSNPNTSIPVEMNFQAIRPNEQPVFFKIRLYSVKNGECISWNSVALEHSGSTTIVLSANDTGYIGKSTIGGIKPNESTINSN